MRGRIAVAFSLSVLLAVTGCSSGGDEAQLDDTKERSVAQATPEANGDAVGVSSGNTDRGGTDGAAADSPTADGAGFNSGEGDLGAGSSESASLDAESGDQSASFDSESGDVSGDGGGTGAGAGLSSGSGDGATQYAAERSDGLSTDGGSTAGGKVALIARMLREMGGAEPSTEDVACVSAALTADDLLALGDLGANADPSTDPRLEPLFSAIFSCKPSALVTDLANGIDNLPVGVTQSERECLARELMDVMNMDKEFLRSVLAAGEFRQVPASVKEDGMQMIAPGVGICISDPVLENQVLEAIRG